MEAGIPYPFNPLPSLCFVLPFSLTHYISSYLLCHSHASLFVSLSPSHSLQLHDSVCYFFYQACHAPPPPPPPKSPRPVSLTFYPHADSPFLCSTRLSSSLALVISHVPILSVALSNLLFLWRLSLSLSLSLSQAFDNSGAALWPVPKESRLRVTYQFSLLVMIYCLSDGFS